MEAGDLGASLDLHWTGLKDQCVPVPVTPPGAAPPCNPFLCNPGALALASTYPPCAPPRHPGRECCSLFLLSPPCFPISHHFFFCLVLGGGKVARPGSLGPSEQGLRPRAPEMGVTGGPRDWRPGSADLRARGFYSLRATRVAGAPV